jgi:hypothetical protein
MIKMAKTSALEQGLWYPRQDEIVYEFTKEPRLLLQYCNLYQAECRMADDRDFRAVEDGYNNGADILIAHINGKCIGGGRLSVRSIEHMKPLPIEIDNFRLENCFPPLKQPGMRYGEISRLVLMPAFRNGRTSLEMWKRFRQRAVRLKLNVTYAAAPLINLRAYRKHCKSIGVDAKIHMDMVLPPYPGFEHITDYLLSCVTPGRSGRGDPGEPPHLRIMRRPPSVRHSDVICHANAER